MSEYSRLPYGDTVLASEALDRVEEFLHRLGRETASAIFTIEGRSEPLSLADAESCVQAWVAKGVPNVRYVIDESQSHDITVDLSARADVEWLKDASEA